MFDLNFAYMHGNFIQQKASLLPSGIETLQFKIGHEPVIIGQTTPGAGNLNGNTLEQSFYDASILASGFSATPDDIKSFSFGALGPGFLALQGSGTQASQIQLLTGAGPFAHVAGLMAKGVFGISANGSLVVNQNGGTGPLLLENKGNGKGEGGQLTLSAFNGSGQFEYRFGEKEGWYMKPSDNIQFVLVPNEDQVRAIVTEMISGLI